MAVPTAQALYEAAKEKLEAAITANNDTKAVNWAKVVFDLNIVKKG